MAATAALQQPPTAATYAWTVGQDLSQEEQYRLLGLLRKHDKSFAFSMNELGWCNVLRFKIPVIGTEPVWRKRHRLSKSEWELVDKQCAELHAAGLIRPSSSDYAAATEMPAKKDSTGMWTEKRMCCDYRPLNAITPQDRYPVPLPEEIFDSLRESRIFSILDLKQGFNQILWRKRTVGRLLFTATHSYGNGSSCHLVLKMRLSHSKE